MSFSVLIPCGPSPREVARIRDILESLTRHEPDYELLVVINDGNEGLGFLDAYPKTVVIPGPRAGRGWGVGGGLVFNQLVGYSHIAAHTTRSRFVLRLDTDAWILGPFSKAIAGEFGDPSVGMIGSFVDSNNLGPDRRTPGISYFAGKAEKLRRWISLWRKPNWRLLTFISPSQRAIQRYFHSAEIHGYQNGFLIEGGAFALGWNWVEFAQTLGLYDQAENFIDTPVTEDLIITMLTYYMGLRAMNSTLFCIEPSGLRYRVEKMIRKAGQSPIIHSVKHEDEYTEFLVRKLLRSTFESSGWPT
jgi:hypothetical protein